MTLRDYARILRRSWVIIVATTVLGALVALGFSLAATPIYRAEAQLFVSVQSGSAYDALSGGYYVQQRMQSYVGLADTPGVLAPVVSTLGLDGSPAVSASSPPDTVLLDVQVTDTDPSTAAESADAVASSLAKEIVRLETTSSGAKPVQAQVVRSADVPTTPISPRTRVNVALGALLGLMVGVGIAFLRATLDTTIKTADDLVAATGTPLLGSIGFDPEAATNPLATLRATPRAEAYRSIRTNLQYVDVDHPPKVVVVTSSMPLEGKSTTAANLAIALAQSGAAVLLVEGDLRRPRVADYLGVDGSVGLTDVLIGRVPFDDAVIAGQRGTLDFLPSGAIPPNPSELLGSQQLVDLLARLGERYGAIVIDAPPLLPVTDAAVLATIADGALLVARCGATRREQAEQAADALRQVNARLVGAILNFVPAGRRSHMYDYGYGYGAPNPATQVDQGRRVLAHDDVPAPSPRT